MNLANAYRATSDETQPALPAVLAQLEQRRVTVFPGSRATVRVTVSNPSYAAADFLVEALGLPADWIKPASLRFPLPAHETTQLQFLIKPERRAEIAPQTFELDVLVSRLDDPARSAMLSCAVELGGFGGLSCHLDPPTCQNGGGVNLYLLNQGNEALHLELAGHDPQSRLEFRLSQTALSLPPGGRAQVRAQVLARRRPILGKTSQVPFAIIAKAAKVADYQAPLPASLIVKPRLSRPVAALLLMLGLAMAVIVAALAYQPPIPSIVSFSAPDEPVARGLVVKLAWHAENASGYRIEVAGERLVALPSDASSFQLDTSAYSQPVDIALIAEGGAAAATESRRLDIYEPVQIAEFYADRRSMLRGVFGALTIRWTVGGAQALDISPPPGFEVVSASAQANPSGWLTLRGAPEAAIKARLRAIDERGNATERILQVDIRDPECSPRQDVWLYAGPDTRHARLSIAVAQVPVLARGANPARDWLQVELARGDIGWGAYSSFFCHGFAATGIKVIGDLPALITATPEIAISPRSPYPPY